MDWISAAIAAIGAVLVAASSAVVTLIVTRKPAQTTADAAQLTAEAAAQTSLNQGFASFNASLMKRLDDLEAQNKAHEERLTAVIHHLENLEAILRDLGHPIPPRIWELGKTESVLGAKVKQ